MTITELLAANPGVKLIMSYNSGLERFHVAAEHQSVAFHTSVSKQDVADNPAVVEAAIKKVLEYMR